MLDLALRVAMRGQRAKPPVAAPPKVTPLLKFKKVPAKAKETLLEVLDTDEEFRARVATAATEAKVGRTAMMFLERPDGWRDFVDTMVEAAEEPVVESSSQIGRLEQSLSAATNARDSAREELAQAQSTLQDRDAEIETLRGELEAARAELEKVQESNGDLVAQRERAVSELKHTEEVMTRHVTERKRLEALTETMTAAQLSTTQVGGSITDGDVRSAVDDLTKTVASLQGQLDTLRSAATPEAVAVERRVPLSVPHGLFDDSVEYAEYLLNIPGMTVLIDGYNVTKEAQTNQDLDLQREWLLNGLATLAARYAAEFEVVFDGADVSTPTTPGRLRHRFTAAGVEADDDIIERVASMDRRKPVAVVSSDKRVRTGAQTSGANLLFSHQLISLL